ncbi:MAG: homoserine dehydrogenase [Spirochaetales bacterium]|nr:homoserine dehydrogenase [Leptospiraceae bacterium]MCP5483815.1 homoserine dehydrogenase [Spirochaetales bacterium]
MKSVRVGIMGLGTVGQGVLRILRDHGEALEHRSGVRFEIVRIFDRSFREKGDVIRDIPASDNMEDVLGDPSIDIVAELLGGIEPAYTVVTRALAAGKDVVTANKALLARHGNELFELSHQHSCEIAFEAAVAAALPVIKNLRRGLIANEIEALYGILNGTCNFIITRMQEDGLDYAAALREAQVRGFAEADPSFDVGGKDAAQKLAIISALAFDTRINEDAVLTEGIEHIRLVDHQIAADLKCVIRLLAVARRDPLQMRVHPVLIHEDHVLAHVRDERNAVFFATSNSGPQLLMGLGAGARPTAAAVVSDLVFLARENPETPEYWISGTKDPVIHHEYAYRFYLRFQTYDRPGVMADLARILAEENISIASVSQKEGPEPVNVVVITHTTPEVPLRTAIKRIDALDTILAPTVAMPMELDL